MHDPMVDQSIRGYLESLAQRGELTRISAEIDPDQNMSAVSWKAFSELGQSCLYENVKGHPDWRVAAQIVANRRKWAIAFGVSEDEVVPTLNARMRRPIKPDDDYDGPAPVKDVIRVGSEVNLDDIPGMWTSEKDPGRYFASGMCIIKDPHTKKRNVSIHRAQILTPNQTGFLICPRQAFKIYEMYAELGEPMEVAMVIGAHPALIFASGFVAPYGLDELDIAGGLLGEPIRMVKCETVDLEVPAEAELVLEGEIIPGERTPEGPFGEVTGTYAQEGSTHLFHVKAVTHRSDPIFYAMQCGLPPSDTHSIVSLTIEMRLWEHIEKVAGGIELLDVRCLGSMTPLMVVIKLKQAYAGEANNVLTAVISSPYLHPKFAIAVDEDVDASDVTDVMWAIATRVNPQEDIQKIDAVRTFTLDNVSDIEPGMSAMYRMGTKMIIDATRPPGTERGEKDPFERHRPFDWSAVNLDDYLIGIK